jgi:hypothetical protein
VERTEIISGLKNAVDRGYSLNKAVESFFNAGYSRQDVIDSANVLGYSGGIISKSTLSNVAPYPIQQPSYPANPQPDHQNSPQPAPKSTPQSPAQPQFQKLPAPQSTQQLANQIKKLPQSPAQQPVQTNIRDDGIKKERGWFARNWLVVFLIVVLSLLMSGLFLSIFYKDILIGWLKIVGINLG